MTSETQVILNALDDHRSALNDHRKEVRGDISELRHATTEMTKAVADLTTTVARVEERHAKQDDGLRRLGKQVDDHETRIRKVEEITQTRGAKISGGWKVLTVLGAIIIAAVAIVTAIIQAAT